MNRVRLQILHHGYSFGRWEEKRKNLVTGFNRIYFFLKGAAEVEYRDRRAALRPGNVYILPGGESYSFLCDRSHEKLYLDFKVEIFPGRDLLSGRTEVSTFPLKHLSPTKQPDFKKMVQATGIGDVFSLKSLVFNALGKMMLLKSGSDFLSTYLNDIKLQEKYRPLFAELDLAPPARVAVSKLARSMNWNLSVLSRNFHKDTGGPLKHYLDQRVLHRAQTELLFSGKKIREIAGSLGFQYETYFSRFFKKHAGMTPETYRQKLQEPN